MGCGDCKYFAPKRSEKTKRILAGGWGDCTFQVVWPKLPDSFAAVYSRIKFILPERKVMHSTCGSNCIAWEFNHNKPHKTQLKILS